MGFPSFAGVDYSNLPLLPAWYIPGWTSQNDAYVERGPGSLFSAVPFPDLNYVLVTGAEFDYDANPLGGYFTFMPSDSMTVISGSTRNRIVQRYTGSDMFSGMGYNQAGSGRVYLYHGQLAVLLLATDNAGILTDQGAPLSYYVKEHFRLGQEYQITVPYNSTGYGPVDIRSLITSGPDIRESTMPVTKISAMSTQNVTVNVSASTFVISDVNLAQYDVNFAFTVAFSQPQEQDWNEGTWLTSEPPFAASILVGPHNNGLVLAQGSYTIWVRVLSPNEVPVAKVGTLIITS